MSHIKERDDACQFADLLVVNDRVVIPDLEEPFDPKEKFRLDDCAGISYAGRPNFQKEFFSTVVEPREGFTLSVYGLQSAYDDGPILKEVGSRCHIDLAALHHLITLQESGERNLLLTDGSFNVCYISDVKKNPKPGLIPVRIRHQKNKGNVVFALMFLNRMKWLFGTHVFAKNY